MIFKYFKQIRTHLTWRHLFQFKTLSKNGPRALWQIATSHYAYEANWNTKLNFAIFDHLNLAYIILTNFNIFWPFSLVYEQLKTARAILNQSEISTNE